MSFGSIWNNHFGTTLFQMFNLAWETRPDSLVLSHWVCATAKTSQSLWRYSTPLLPQSQPHHQVEGPSFPSWGSGLVSPDICLLLFFPSDVLFYFFIVPSNSLLPLIISSNTYIACLPSSSRPLLQSKTTDILLHRNDHFIHSSSDTCIQSHPSIPPAFSLIFNPSPSLGACNPPRRADAG